MSARVYSYHYHQNQMKMYIGYEHKSMCSVCLFVLFMSVSSSAVKFCLSLIFSSHLFKQKPCTLSLFPLPEGRLKSRQSLLTMDYRKVQSINCAGELQQLASELNYTVSFDIFHVKYHLLLCFIHIKPPLDYLISKQETF